MIDGWEQRLNDYLEECRHKAFRWGHNDCVKFAFKGLKRIHFIDFQSQLFEWNSKKTGLVVIKRYGKDLGDAANKVLPGLGFNKADIGFAGRGDLIITETKLGPMFALCIGSKIVAPGKFGLEFLPLRGECWKFKGDK